MGIPGGYGPLCDRFTLVGAKIKKDLLGVHTTSLAFIMMHLKIRGYITGKI